jgi:hypothetical protein
VALRPRLSPGVPLSRDGAPARPSEAEFIPECDNLHFSPSVAVISMSGTTLKKVIHGWARWLLLAEAGHDCDSSEVISLHRFWNSSHLPSPWV